MLGKSSDIRNRIYFINSHVPTGGVMNRPLVVGLLLAAAGAAYGQTASAPTTQAARAAGAQLFRSHCASCHGLNGAGGIGPSLTSGVFFHGSTDADLFRNISKGVPGTSMPDQFFSSAQIWQIVRMCDR